MDDRKYPWRFLEDCWTVLQIEMEILSKNGVELPWITVSCLHLKTILSMNHLVLMKYLNNQALQVSWRHCQWSLYTPPNCWLYIWYYDWFSSKNLLHNAKKVMQYNICRSSIFSHCCMQFYLVFDHLKALMLSSDYSWSQTAHGVIDNYTLTEMRHYRINVPEAWFHDALKWLAVVHGSAMLEMETITYLLPMRWNLFTRSGDKRFGHRHHRTA